ncbi:MAG: 3-hydroxybutyryl-CoA dehydrogenase [Gemmatimonadaceae bacterium]|nr:3-hydroxybutyryl-CoA dehydrogenase [Gemmatimonadaceae bacterium]
MGSGIAQVALVHGHRVLLTDALFATVLRAQEQIARALAREVEKGRLTAATRDAALARLQLVEPDHGVGAFRECSTVIEAIVEKLDVKQATFRALEHVVSHDCILATNTSSLSVASIGGGCQSPERVLGVHFFNPAPVMPLVEIVPGIRTDPAVAERATRLVQSWGKVTVRASDTPGFIVNRIARPFYGEALRMLEEGVADVATIDWAMKTIGGFRMGPFELMDFIGHDVNYVVTESVWSAMYYDPRYRPSLTQKRLLEAGLLGRKSGRGFYDYREGAPAPQPVKDETLGTVIVRRTLAMLVNEAADALYLRIASAADIELAMTKGVNYPKGLLAWGNEVGLSRLLEHLEALQAETGDDRYRPSPLFRRMVRNAESFQV